MKGKHIRTLTVFVGLILVAPASADLTVDMFTSVQVNVDGNGDITGDAANEPSIAVYTDAVGEDQIIIAWRQFDAPACSNLFTGTHDGGFSTTILSDSGQNWTPGHLVGRFVVNDSANGGKGLIVANEATTARVISLGTNKFWQDGHDYHIVTAKQAGVGWSANGGSSWTAYELDNTDTGGYQETYSDPVAAVDNDGIFYTYFLDRSDTRYFYCDLFKSDDTTPSVAADWTRLVPADQADKRGGDKGWIAVDRNDGADSENYVYAAWDSKTEVNHRFARSKTGTSYHGKGPTAYPVTDDEVMWGNVAVDADSNVYVIGKEAGLSLGDDSYYNDFYLVKSTDAQDPQDTSFTFTNPVYHPVTHSVKLNFGSGEHMLHHKTNTPNPEGMMGPLWVACDAADSDKLYALGTFAIPDAPNDDDYYTDVVFIKSTDAGVTWSTPKTVNDDDPATDGESDGWAWFGTLSVSPNGRVDVFYNSTPYSGDNDNTKIMYRYFDPAASAWSTSIQVTDVWDSKENTPLSGGAKIGDYMQSFSENEQVHLAYAATLVNNEQNIFHLRFDWADCDEDGIIDAWEIDDNSDLDCNSDGAIDACAECPWDVSFNGTVDPVDVGLVKQKYGCSVGVGNYCTCDIFDISDNGTVDPVDIGIVKQHYGSCP